MFPCVEKSESGEISKLPRAPGKEGGFGLENPLRHAQKPPMAHVQGRVLSDGLFRDPAVHIAAADRRDNLALPAAEA